MGKSPPLQSGKQVFDCHSRHQRSSLQACAADVRDDQTIGQTEEGIVRRHRLGICDIQSRAADLTRGKRIRERCLIHHPASRSVDQNGAGLHQAELTGADQVPGLRVKSNVEADEIRRFQKLILLDSLHAERRLDFGARLVAIQHLHAEGAGAAGNRLADFSHPENSQGRPVDFDSQQKTRLPGYPFAGADKVPGLSNSSRRGQ